MDKHPNPSSRRTERNAKDPPIDRSVSTSRITRQEQILPLDIGPDAVAQNVGESWLRRWGQVVVSFSKR
jgi:hypothetical protein